jgi:hypothetical protein
MADPAAFPQTDAAATLARTLAAEHGAAALAAALIVRLRADQRGELADAIVALLSANDPIIDPGPPSPH